MQQHTAAVLGTDNFNYKEKYKKNSKNKQYSHCRMLHWTIKG
jgi:hypothetical protein